MEQANGAFKIVKAGDAPASAAASGATPGKLGGTWRKLLENAWVTYCKAETKEDRSVEAFIAVLPKGARNTKPEGATKPASKVAAVEPKKKKDKDKKRAPVEASADEPAKKKANKSKAV